MIVNVIVFMVLSGIIVLFIIVVYCVMMIIKNNVNYKNHNKILNAIDNYNFDMIKQGKPENVIHCGDEIKNYDKILNNIFDWGYKNILPKDKFEKIRNYIE